MALTNPFKSNRASTPKMSEDNPFDLSKNAHITVQAEQLGNLQKNWLQRLVIKLRNWRQLINISNLLSAVVLCSVVIASVAAGSYAFNLLYEKALRDTWAILFLEGEATAEDIKRALPLVAMRDRKQQLTGQLATSDMRRPNAIYRLEDKTATPVFGSRGYAKATPKDLGWRSFENRFDWSIFKYKKIGHVGTVRNGADASKLAGRKLTGGEYLILWQFDFAKLLALPEIRQLDSERLMYFMNRGGQLIYANSFSVKQDNLPKRPLIEEFIKSELARGQIEFTNFDEAAYGSFYEIQGTNLVMFTELSTRNALATIGSLAQQYAWVVLLIVVILGILIQYPLRLIAKPLVNLTTMAGEVSRGNFNIQPADEGFGEVKTLARSFAVMTNNLVQRDTAIKALMREQEEKIRMEQELGVAKGLQDNFLPQHGLPPDSGIRLASIYIPAAHCAGDWYNHHYNEKTGESVIIIADVSGHDMAASMFTAVIAGLFFETVDSDLPTFPTEDFAQRLSRRILHFGRGKWHATMQIVVHKAGEEQLSVFNAGHTFGLQLAGPNTKKTKYVRLPSDPVGALAEPQTATKSIPFKHGDTFLMYTDGITEMRRKDGRLYGSKRLYNKGKELADDNPTTIIAQLRHDAEQFRGDVPAQDDLCLIAFQLADVS